MMMTSVIQKGLVAWYPALALVLGFVRWTYATLWKT